MNKEELIKKILKIKTPSAGKPDPAYKKIKGYCDRYKEETGDTCLDEVFQNYYTPEEQLALLKATLGDCQTVDKNTLAKGTALLRFRNYSTEIAELNIHNNFMDIGMGDITRIKQKIIEKLLDSNFKKYLIQMLENVDETGDPDDALEDIRTIVGYYNEAYRTSFACDLLSHYLKGWQIEDYIRTNGANFRKWAEILEELIETDRDYISDNVRVDNNGCLHYIHSDDIEYLQKELINVLTQELELEQKEN